MYRKVKDPYDSTVSTFINIQMIKKITVDRNNPNVSRISMIDDAKGEFIQVSTSDAEEIIETLSKQKDRLSGEVSTLTIAIRDLWQLLRARLR